MTCKDCLHYAVCIYLICEKTDMTVAECPHFTDRSEWVHLPCAEGTRVCSVVNGNSKVIGEFICNKIDRLAVCGYDNRNTELRRVDDNLTAYDLDYDYLNKCQLSLDNLKKYSNGGGLYGWHISDLVIYDKPKELSEFGKPVICHRGIQKDNCNGCWDCEIKRPPQSWCYVEEVSNNA